MPNSDQYRIISFCGQYCRGLNLKKQVFSSKFFIIYLSITVRRTLYLYIYMFTFTQFPYQWNYHHYSIMATWYGDNANFHKSFKEYSPYLKFETNYSNIWLFMVIISRLFSIMTEISTCHIFATNTYTATHIWFPILIKCTSPLAGGRITKCRRHIIACQLQKC